MNRLAETDLDLESPGIREQDLLGTERQIRGKEKTFSPPWMIHRHESADFSQRPPDQDRLAVYLHPMFLEDLKSDPGPELPQVFQADGGAVKHPPEGIVQSSRQ